MIGQKLGHFRIVERIGAGGMGVVYRAHDAQLDRDVAIKVLPASTLANDAARKRFRQEALTLSKLNHPNIETLHEFASESEVDYLVMEYVAGTTLSDRLAGGPLPEKEILHLGEQLAEGLAAAHEHGVIHRDLKPGNLRVTPDGRLKILDFGLAKLKSPESDAAPTESLSASHAVAGTLPYMAPEQASGEPTDPRSDLYAAGVVLYEMATGQRLFPGDRGPLQLLNAILHEKPRLPSALNPRVSAGLESIILKCVEKDPEYRYQSAKEILADLRRLEAGSTISPARARRPLLHIWQAAALAVAILAGFVLLRGTGGWRKLSRAGAAPPHVESLAVLPFAGLSGDPGQDYFVDGITDALITDLGQAGALRVISRTSVMQYKAGTKPLREIAKELNVDAIVEGSVTRSGDHARVSARLIYASTDTQLWSGSFDRNMSDLVALQGELAGTIVKEIKGALTTQEQARLRVSRPVNPEAQEAYLRGNYLVHGTNEQRRKAAEYFERAIQLDSQFALPYAGLAEYYWSNLELPSREAIRTAKEFAQKSLQLDPDLAPAHRALATILFLGDWDWPGAEKEFKNTIQLNPSDAEAHRMYSYFLSTQNQSEAALEQIREAQSLDPLFLASQITAGWVLYYARQYDRAIEQCQKALELDPKSVGAHDCLGSAYMMKGATGDAVAHCQQAAELSSGDPARAAELGRAYARAGRKAEARQVLLEMEQRAKTSSVPPYLIAMVYVALGEKEKGIVWLEKASEERDRYLVLLAVDPAFDPARDDPRFGELLRRVGLAPH